MKNLRKWFSADRAAEAGTRAVSETLGASPTASTAPPSGEGPNFIGLAAFYMSRIPRNVKRYPDKCLSYRFTRK